MAGKLFIYHGLPGSGKSTLAEKNAAKDLNSIVVNSDTIRETLFGKDYQVPDKREIIVRETLERLISKGLKENKNVHNDDTNLNTKTILSTARLAQQQNADIEQIFVDVPIEEAKKRNRLRSSKGGRFVPEEVIDAMAMNSYTEDGKLSRFKIEKNYVSAPGVLPKGQRILKKANKEFETVNPFNGKAIVLVDIDGTLASNSKELDTFFGKKSKRDYVGFYKSIKDSVVNKQVRDLANKMRVEDNVNIVVLTGRSDIAAKELIEFVKKSGLKVSRVIAKNHNDHRKSFVYKKEQVDLLKKEGFIPVHVFDDRKQDIDMYKNDLKIIVSEVQERRISGTRKEHEYTEPKVSTIYGTGRCLRCGRPLKQGNIGPKCLTLKDNE